MAQEFTIKSEQIESKINQLLPSQGGFGAGVDISARTMLIPIVDLTETAEGSSLRQDLQSAFSHNTGTVFNITNTTTTILNTTGYFRVFGVVNLRLSTAFAITAEFNLNDGTTDKEIFKFSTLATSSQAGITTTPFDFIIKLDAGDSFTGSTNNTIGNLSGITRQIADVNGNLVNP